VALPGGTEKNQEEYVVNVLRACLRGSQALESLMRNLTEQPLYEWGSEPGIKPVQSRSAQLIM